MQHARQNAVKPLVGVGRDDLEDCIPFARWNAGLQGQFPIPEPGVVRTAVAYKIDAFQPRLQDFNRYRIAPSNVLFDGAVPEIFVQTSNLAKGKGLGHHPNGRQGRVGIATPVANQLRIVNAVALVTNVPNQLLVEP